MSLNYDISKIENNHELKTFGYYDHDDVFVLYPADELVPKGAAFLLKAQLECLIWISLLAGFDEITKDNWPEVFIRVAMVETCIGPYRSSSEGGIYYKPEEVKRCIGLKTNATKLTPAAFDKQAARMLRRPCEQALRLYQANLEIENDQVQTAVEGEA